jgi:hypothetical protein
MFAGKYTLQIGLTKCHSGQTAGLSARRIGFTDVRRARRSRPTSSGRFVPFFGWILHAGRMMIADTVFTMEIPDEVKEFVCSDSTVGVCAERRCCAFQSKDVTRADHFIQ